MSAAGVRIAVFGTLNRDTTRYADGTCTENLGGLLYTLATLAALGAGAVAIEPVANVGFDLYERVYAALDLPGMVRGGLQRVSVPNNHVLLTYTDAAERDEVLVGRVPPLLLSQCLAARDADWVLVNFTSGFDLELATLAAFRSATRATIHLDVHSLTLGIEPGGRRFLRCPPRWREYVACADWLQMNETEARLLGDSQPVEEFASALLDLGPRGVLVTRGRRGCMAAWRAGCERRTLSLSPRHIPEPAFPTGCGDVFGAAFAYALCRGCDPATALDFASELASLKAGREPLAALHDLRSWAVAPLARCIPAAAAPGRREDS
jgi:sugar/nucleoside kinase (ribokinase family)